MRYGSLRFASHRVQCRLTAVMSSALAVDIGSRAQTFGLGGRLSDRNIAAQDVNTHVSAAADDLARFGARFVTER